MAFKNQGLYTPRVLVVDDTNLDRIIILAILRKLKCEITVAHNGKEAVDLFHQGQTFDIVFCDKDMPVMTGPEAISKIRGIGATELKIVGVSADSDGMEAFMGAGADMFVPKPITLGIVGPILEDIVNKDVRR